MGMMEGNNNRNSGSPRQRLQYQRADLQEELRKTELYARELGKRIEDLDKALQNPCGAEEQATP